MERIAPFYPSPRRVLPASRLAFVVLLVGGFLFSNSCVTEKTFTLRGTIRHQPEVKKADTPPAAQYYYVVRKGDSLTRIAKLFGTTVPSLVKANRIPNPNRIIIGQRIYLPGGCKKIQLASIRKPSVPPIRSEKPPARAPRQVAQTASKTRASSYGFIWPLTTGWISRGFDLRVPHKGLDIASPRGTPVLAARSGEVVYSGNEISGYGNMVWIEHSGSYTTIYAHHYRNLVKDGARVKQGQPIGLVGSTGHSSGNHLHFEIRVNGVAKDPLKYLSPTKSMTKPSRKGSYTTAHGGKK